MNNIVLVGSSGHAKVVIDIVEREGKYSIAGLIDAFRQIGEQTLDYRILGTEADLPRLVAEHDIKGALIAIGDNLARSNIAAKVAEYSPQLPFVSAIHPRATVGRGATVDAGTVLMAGAVVNPCCRVGRFCILNTNSSLDHDSMMDDFSSLAPGAVTGGNCRIGRYAAISIGAVLRHGITVGEHSVVGAGATVLTDVDPYSVAYGSPAKKVRDRMAGERYF
ncbi:acetyltransferase [Paraburkholderia kirstenboschensis]|uniref:Acetyltransferase n=1 Tax=Paraburkholderia kirstenboschensis TaxID=1245436 RepID=A0ABZ0EPA2_9BURK|nr:acetyltransferase [Paraburkholderia kirstenboschensis]WOD17918.1 acetyltransferase [Paraburkholderia kirstenboschensis]